VPGDRPDTGDAAPAPEVSNTEGEPGAEGDRSDVGQEKA
jgi:hypothetical protein